MLADRHHQLIEGVRNLLEASFDKLFIVGNQDSLIEGAARLQPAVLVVDLSFIPMGLPEMLRQVRAFSPDSKILLLSVHDEANVAQFGRDAGADGVVLKRAIATDLPAAIDAVLANRSFVSAGITGL